MRGSGEMDAVEGVALAIRKVAGKGRQLALQFTIYNLQDDP